VATIGIASIPMSLSVPGIPSGGLFILAPLFVRSAIGKVSESSSPSTRSGRVQDCRDRHRHMASTTILRAARQRVSVLEECRLTTTPRPAVASIDVG
jgi:hypothetical protein